MPEILTYTALLLVVADQFLTTGVVASAVFVSVMLAALAIRAE
jgi:hypothetical protein